MAPGNTLSTQTTTGAAKPCPISLSLANGATILQAAAPIATIPGNLTPVTTVSAAAAAPPQLQSLLQPVAPQSVTQINPGSIAATAAAPPTAAAAAAVAPAPITIQLPTQPQPVQTVKSVTYVAASKSPNPQTVTTSTFQPVKLTTTGFAITPSGTSI